MLTFDFDTFPILETERLILKPISMEFVEDMFRHRSNVSVMQYIARPLVNSIRQAEELVRDYEFLYEHRISISWAITIKGRPGMIGTVGYPRIKKENYRGEVGYSLHPDFWGSGYMSEALKKVLAFGFERLHFHSIEALISPENKASVGIVLKHGFVKEAYFKDYIYSDGKFMDTEIYSLLADQ